MNGLRLTARGELLLAVTVGVALIGAVWAASAIGYLLTGVSG